MAHDTKLVTSTIDSDNEAKKNNLNDSSILTKLIWFFIALLIVFMVPFMIIMYPLMSKESFTEKISNKNIYNSLI